MSEKYPDGKLRDDDEGVLGIKISVQLGRVVIDFGEPVTWIGLEPEGAAELAQLLAKHAAKASGEPITITLGE